MARAVGQHAWSLGLEEYAICLGGLLEGGVGIHVLSPADVTHKAAAGAVMACEPSTHAVVGGRGRVVPLMDESVLRELVLREVRQNATGVEVDSDVPLMEMGVDSLAATELSSRLSSLTSVEVS